MTQCKSCGAEIRWAQGPSRPLCLNAEPAMVASGWQLTSASGHPVATWSPVGPLRLLHVAHWATCPQARDWRGKGKQS